MGEMTRVVFPPATPAAGAASFAAAPFFPRRMPRRIRPRSRPQPQLPPPPPPPLPLNFGSIARGRGGSYSRLPPGEARAPSTSALPGMSMSLLLSLLAVSVGDAPAAAAAAAASSLSSPWFPSRTTTAFCFPTSTRRPVDVSPAGSGGPNPSLVRPSRRRSTGAAGGAAGTEAAPAGRGRVTGCCWKASAPPQMLWSSTGSHRTMRGGGGRFFCGKGSRSDRGVPLPRVSSIAVGLGHADDWGGGTEEVDYRPEGGWEESAGWGGGWDENMDFVSSFGFARGEGSGYDSHGEGEGEENGDGELDGGPDGVWGGDTYHTVPPLSERDKARLEEVGLMVKELEAVGDGTAPAAPAAAPAAATVPVAARGGQPPTQRQLDERGRGDAEEQNLVAESDKIADFVRGVAKGNTHLRSTCGDPVFFGQLADLMQRLNGAQSSRGGKFLSHAEEKALGAKVQRYRELIELQEKAEKECGRRPPLREVARLSAGLSDEAFAAVMQDGMEARQKLVVCNLALVVSLSHKYKRSHFNCNCLQTLIQEGTIGLIRAAERYDPDKGFRFTTYAIWWIEARLRVSVQTEERIIHVPMWIKNKYNVVSRSIPKLRRTLARDPTPKEIAAQVAIDTDSKVVLTPERVKELQTWVSFHRKHESLDTPLDAGTPLSMDCSTIAHGVKAPEPSLESASELEIQRDFLESCLRQDLSRIQRKILRMKVGLGGGKGKNRREISRALKMPFNNVISEERKAFYKLRGLRRAGGYPSFEELK